MIKLWILLPIVYLQANVFNQCKIHPCFLLDEEGLSLATPEVPTEEKFDSLFDRFLGFFGRSSVSSAFQSPDLGNSSGYQVYQGFEYWFNS